MVEPIYCLKPAWCGRHLAGLRPETGLTVRYGATAFKAVGYHFKSTQKGTVLSYPTLPLLQAHSSIGKDSVESAVSTQECGYMWYYKERPSRLQIRQLMWSSWKPVRM